MESETENGQDGIQVAGDQIVVGKIIDHIIGYFDSHIVYEAAVKNLKAGVP
jgi:hypothetical protein